MPENPKRRAARQKKYNATPKAKAKRAANNRARAKIAESRGVKPTQLKGDVHHKDGNPLNNGKKNLTVLPKSKNRAIGNNKGKKKRTTKKAK